MDRPYLAGEKPAVVIELGSALLKVGFAGESCPRYILRSEIGDFEAQSPPPGVEAWDEFLTPMFAMLFSKFLLVKPKERRVLVLENLLSSRSFRLSVARLLFDKFKVPSLAFLPYTTVALAATGSVDGLMVDWGWKETRICPIIDEQVILSGYQGENFYFVSLLFDAIGAASCWLFLQPMAKTHKVTVISQSAFLVCPLGALTMIESIVSSLHEKELLKPSRIEMEEAKPIRELAEDILVRGVEAFRAQETANFLIHGLTTLAVPRAIHDRALEVCLEGDCVEDSVAAGVLEALLQASVDIRWRLAGRIICFGGAAMLKGMKDRLLKRTLELLSSEPRYRALQPLAGRMKLVPLPFAPNALSWCGGAVLASLDVLAQEAMSSAQFADRNGFLHDWLKVSEDSPLTDPATNRDNDERPINIPRWTKFRVQQRPAGVDGSYPVYGLPSFEK